MRVVLAGGSGLIGTALGHALRRRGDEVCVLTRHKPQNPWEVAWDPRRTQQRLPEIDGFDAIVSLCGAPLATRPWTAARRRVLLDSRILSTEVLTGALSRLQRPPHTWVGVATLGRFGDRGDTWTSDDDRAGEGFLATLGQAWEASQLAVSALGLRVAIARYGVVLSPEGGALPLLVKPFTHGFGGWLDKGAQYLPWTSIDDAVGSLMFALDHPGVHGAFNASSPHVVTNREFCEAVGRVLGKEVTHHAPRWVVRGAWGDLADALLLASLRVRGDKITAAGFVFQDDDLDRFLRRTLPLIV